jgi:hypothetical protein
MDPVALHPNDDACDRGKASGFAAGRSKQNLVIGSDAGDNGLMSLKDHPAAAGFNQGEACNAGAFPSFQLIGIGRGHPEESDALQGFFLLELVMEPSPIFPQPLGYMEPEVGPGS